MNPIWDEIFQISKKIGTSCWGIVNFVSGKFKVVHHDQVQPAGTRQDASMVMGSSVSVQNPQAPAGNFLFVDNRLPQQNLPVIDRQQFASDVFNMPSSAVFALTCVTRPFSRAQKGHATRVNICPISSTAGTSIPSYTTLSNYNHQIREGTQAPN